MSFEKQPTLERSELCGIVGKNGLDRNNSLDKRVIQSANAGKYGHISAKALGKSTDNPVRDIIDDFEKEPEIMSGPNSLEFDWAHHDPAFQVGSVSKHTFHRGENGLTYSVAASRLQSITMPSRTINHSRAQIWIQNGKEVPLPERFVLGQDFDGDESNSLFPLQYVGHEGLGKDFDVDEPGGWMD